jgi:putative transposase
MGKPYSMDLRERVVASVEREGLSRRQASAMGLVSAPLSDGCLVYAKRAVFRPARWGGHRPKKIAGEHRGWLLVRCRAADFTLRGLVIELAERGLAVDYRSVWEFVHAEKLSHKERR